MIIQPPIYLNGSREVLSDVESLMIGESWTWVERGYSRSITKNIPVLGIGKGQTPPDAIALTMFSAIPVADTVRGVYEAAGIPSPPIIGVASNHEARDYHRTHSACFDAEVEYLREELGGAKTAVVIDQFILSRTSRNYAADLLKFAGVQECGFIDGNWYQDRGETAVDIPGMTSSLSGQMRSIGHACYEKFLELQE